MANGVDNLKGIAQSFWGAIQKNASKPDSELFKKIDQDHDGKLRAKEIMLYVLAPENQKLFGSQLKSLEAAFKVIGIDGELFQKLLLDDEKTAGKTLREKGDGYLKNSQALAESAKTLSGAEKKDKEKASRDEVIRAKQSYELAIKLDSTDAVSYRRLAEISYQEAKHQGDPEKGKTALNLARQSFESALANETDPAAVTELGKFIEKNDPQYKPKSVTVEVATPFFRGRAAEAKDDATAERYRNRALFGYEPYFSLNEIGDNAAVSALLDELRIQGVPLAAIKPDAVAELDQSKSGKVELDVASVLTWVEAKLDDPKEKPRVIAALKAAKLWPPPWQDSNGRTKKAYDTAEFEKLNFAQKFSYCHAKLATEAKTAKAKEGHLARATQFDVGNAAYHRALGDFYAEQAGIRDLDSINSKTNPNLSEKKNQKLISQAKAAYKQALYVNGGDTDSLIGMGKISYAAGDIDQAYKYFMLPDVKAKAPLALQKIAREKLEFDRKKFDAAVHAEKEDVAKALLPILLATSKELINPPNADPAQYWNDLKTVRAVYKDANDFALFRDGTRPYEKDLQDFDLAIAGLNERLRISLQGDAAKSLKDSEKVAIARQIVDMDLAGNLGGVGQINSFTVDGKEYTGKEAHIRQTLADLDVYTAMLDNAPAGSISDEVRAEGYLKVFNVLIRYRENTGADGKLIMPKYDSWTSWDEDVIHKKLKHVGGKFLETPPFNSDEFRSTYNRILDDVAEHSNTRYLPLLSTDKLLEYAHKVEPLKKKADEELQQAYQETDPKKQRALLLSSSRQIQRD